MPTAREQATRMAIICAAAFFVSNAAFYVLSIGYFDSHREIVAGVGSVLSYSPAEMMHVRTTFAVFSGVVAVFGFLAGIWPRVVGHLIPLLLSAFHLAAGVAAFSHNLPSVLGVTLFVSGLLMPALAWHSHRRRRPAWAFLIAICGVFAVIEFFGAPKVRSGLDVGLWITMILPGLNAVAVAALVSLREAYVEREPGIARRPRA